MMPYGSHSTAEIAECDQGESDLFDNNAEHSEHSEAIKLAEVNFKWQIRFEANHFYWFRNNVTMRGLLVGWCTIEIHWTNDNLLGFFLSHRRRRPMFTAHIFSALGYLLKVPITYGLIYVVCRSDTFFFSSQSLYHIFFLFRYQSFSIFNSHHPLSLWTSIRCYHRHILTSAVSNHIEITCLVIRKQIVLKLPFRIKLSLMRTSGKSV